MGRIRERPRALPGLRKAIAELEHHGCTVFPYHQQYDGLEARIAVLLARTFFLDLAVERPCTQTLVTGSKSSPWQRSISSTCVPVSLTSLRTACWKSCWVRKSGSWQALTRAIRAMTWYSCRIHCFTLCRILALVSNWLLRCTTRVWIRVALVTTWH